MPINSDTIDPISYDTEELQTLKNIFRDRIEKHNQTGGFGLNPTGQATVLNSLEYMSTEVYQMSDNAAKPNDLAKFKEILAEYGTVPYAQWLAMYDQFALRCGLQPFLHARGAPGDRALEKRLERLEEKATQMEKNMTRLETKAKQLKDRLAQALARNKAKATAN